MEKIIISENALRDMAEMLLDMQDSATRYDIISRIYRTSKGSGLYIPDEECEAIFGKKESETNDDISDR
jgi:hypothetical protein